MYKQIISTGNKGFQLTFENGLTISVQWGVGNYCENRQYSDYSAPMKKEIWDCSTAEIAIWDKSDVWHNFGSDTVKGYVSSDEIAKWVSKVQRAKSIKSIRNK
jgi:hypothetical protein